MAVQDPPPPGSVEGQKAGVVAYRQEPDGTYATLLITARRQRAAWIFPVGTVDPGETLEQAAARECMEESGYTVRTGPLLKALDLAHKKRPPLFVFCCPGNGRGGRVRNRPAETLGTAGPTRRYRQRGVCSSRPGCPGLSVRLARQT